MREQLQENLFNKYRALTWIGGIICFVIVPLLLFNALLDNMLRLRCENEKQQTFAEMADRLDHLSQHVDISHFLHRLLKEQVDRADRQKDPIASIRQSIHTLKKRYPGLFKFIVWNQEGRTIAALTDEKSYRYIVSNLYDFFGEIARHCRAEYPGFPEMLPIVQNRINMFRAYLGRFLVPSHLRYPFQKGNHGRMILSEAPARFPLFWFDTRDRFTFFCMANPQEKHRHIGVKHALSKPFQANGKMVTGFVDLREIKQKRANNAFEQMIELELGKYENASLPQRDLPDHLITFKLLDPYLRGYCCINKDDLKHARPKRRKTEIFVTLTIVTALMAFIFYCYSLRLKRLTFSIRTRIALLFLYANGLPLLILGTIGHEYLQQLETSLLQAKHKEHERILEEVDSGFRRFCNLLAEKTRETLATYTLEIRDRQPHTGDSDFFTSAIEKLAAEEVYIYGKEGEILLSCRRTKKAQSQTMMKLFSAYALHYMNRGYEIKSDVSGNIGPAKYFDLSKESIARESPVMFKSLMNINKRIEKFSFGIDQRLCFISFFGDEAKRAFHSFIMISWLHEQVQENYADHQAKELTTGRQKHRLVCLAQNSGSIHGDKTLPESRLRPILQKAFTLEAARENSFYHDGRRYLITALAGRQLDNLSLAVIVDAREIEAAVKAAETKLFWLAMLSLAIVSGVVFALSRQFIEPVRQLSETVNQIGRRNFAYRNTIENNDEFGDLGKVFNSTMAGMHELEIGKLIQKTLLPDGHYSNGRVEIYARSVAMTKLGGDYFDYCQPAPKTTGVFMGDVAGHGIPAALIMAMAKAIVLIDRQSQIKPSELLKSLHDVLFKLKSDKFKRMMTCQYMVINNNTGACSFANAGHCYPIKVGHSGSSAEFAEIIGAPVGISRRARYEDHELAIEPGDTLILYSDGMLEARNFNGVEYGPERLLQLTREAWHTDLKQYYTNLYQANLTWSAAVEDDITIVLVRFKREEQA